MYYRVSTGYGLFAEADRFSLKLLLLWLYDLLYYIAHAVNGECMIAMLIANYGDELVLATSYFTIGDIFVSSLRQTIYILTKGE